MRKKGEGEELISLQRGRGRREREDGAEEDDRRRPDHVLSTRRSPPAGLFRLIPLFERETSNARRRGRDDDNGEGDDDTGEEGAEKDDGGQGRKQRDRLVVRTRIGQEEEEVKRRATRNTSTRNVLTVILSYVHRRVRRTHILLVP